MNKKLNILRIISIIVTIILSILFYMRYGISMKILLLYISLIILLIINIEDKNIKLSNKYNILFIIIMFITSFILFRSLYDTNLISNSISHLNSLNSIYMNLSLSKEYQNIGLYYLEENIYLLVILYISIFLYRKLELKNVVKSKYSLSSIICLIINIMLVIKTLEYLVEPISINHFPLLFLTVNVILLVVEIVSLIKNNNIKREWPIYLSFIFNLFAFIAIFT